MKKCLERKLRMNAQQLECPPSGGPKKILVSQKSQWLSLALQRNFSEFDFFERSLIDLATAYSEDQSEREIEDLV